MSWLKTFDVSFMKVHNVFFLFLFFLYLIVLCQFLAVAVAIAAHVLYCFADYLIADYIFGHFGSLQRSANVPETLGFTSYILFRFGYKCFCVVQLPSKCFSIISTPLWFWHELFLLILSYFSAVILLSGHGTHNFCPTVLFYIVRVRKWHRSSYSVCVVVFRFITHCKRRKL